MLPVNRFYTVIVSPSCNKWQYIPAKHLLIIRQTMNWKIHLGGNVIRTNSATINLNQETEHMEVLQRYKLLLPVSC